MAYSHIPLALLSYSIISLLITLPLPAKSAADRSALLSIKSLLSDPNDSLSSWTNASLRHCRWRGVTCGSHHTDRVTALDLGALRLSGTISPSISNLTFLRALHLPENSLHGPIPPDLTHLSRLKHLNLSMNSLTGSIPPLLGISPSLTYVDLSNNTLTGAIPSSLGTSQSLQVLVLSHNNITGPIPPSIFTSPSLGKIDLSSNSLEGSIPPFAPNPNLSYINLSSNRLTGEIPHSLGNLSSLQVLYLADNRLSGNIPDTLGRIPYLQELELSLNNLSSTIPSSLNNLTLLAWLGLGYNKLTGTLPPDLGLALPNLFYISVRSNRLHGPIPSSLSNATSLQMIDLSNNSFTGEVPNNLGSLPSLTNLDLGWNKLQAKDWSFLSSLTNCSLLQSLYLYDNRIEGIIPSSIGKLSSHLKWLWLGKNQITGQIPDEIGNLVNLAVLHLDQNKLAGGIPAVIGKLRKLDLLDLSQNNLSGTIPSSLSDLPILEELYLQENQLSGTIPESLQNFPTLRLMNMSHNSLTGRIPREILTITSLTQSLDLSHNSLMGSIPGEIGHLINLGRLDVSENRLSGYIPHALGDCRMLEHLVMAGNSFQGSIPETFSDLGGLSVLDMSRNSLSGQIPDFFKNFNSLHSLNLSYNDFEGEVPSGGVFDRSTEVSVVGNKKLCSDRSILQLSSCSIHGRNRRLKHIAVIILTVSAFLILALCFFAILYRRKKSSKKCESSGDDKYPKVSYADISKATNEFSHSNLVGTGSFGSVYKAKFDLEETAVAVKVLNLSRRGASKSFIAECNTLRNIRHRNLVKILTVCSTVDPKGNDFKALIFEYMPFGSLDRWLHPEASSEQHQHKKLSLVQRLSIAADVASVLDYLHNNCNPPVVHCDLKPSNILLNNDMLACVGDFGLSRFLATSMLAASKKSISSIGLKGSVGYVAPEYGMNGQISKEGDSYSFGVLLLEMMIGKRPTDDMFKDGLNLHKYVKLAFPENVMNILDPHFFQDEEVIPKSTDQQITSAAQERTRRCIFSLIKVGLLCSSELPRDRMGMREATIEIHAIKELLSVAYVQEEGEIE